MITGTPNAKDPRIESGRGQTIVTLSVNVKEQMWTVSKASIAEEIGIENESMNSICSSSKLYDQATNVSELLTRSNINISLVSISISIITSLLPLKLSNRATHLNHRTLRRITIISNITKRHTPHLELLIFQLLKAMVR